MAKDNSAIGGRRLAALKVTIKRGSLVLNAMGEIDAKFQTAGFWALTLDDTDLPKGTLIATNVMQSVMARHGAFRQLGGWHHLPAASAATEIV